MTPATSGFDATCCILSDTADSAVSPAVTRGHGDRQAASQIEVDNGPSKAVRTRHILREPCVSPGRKPVNRTQGNDQGEGGRICGLPLRGRHQAAGGEGAGRAAIARGSRARERVRDDLLLGERGGNVAFRRPDPRRIHHLPRDQEFLIELPQSVQVLRITSSKGVFGA
jgi:hypothetical protein